MNRAENTGSRVERIARPVLGDEGGIDIRQFVLMLERRKLLVIAIFLVATAVAVVYSSRLPNFYTSETVILVDPQQVPDRYVTPTVGGDVRNRLGTLTQQVLSESRLQLVIDKFGLYPVERLTRPREDVTASMRKDIVIDLSGDARGVGTFRISYTGRDPVLVAKVTTELASLFIEENLKARELTATGTTDFLQSQLDETRKTLEQQESRLKAYKLSHMGEMPDQQQTNLQILSQLQSQLTAVTESIARSEQQKSYLQAMMSEQQEDAPAEKSPAGSPRKSSSSPSAKSPLPPTPSEAQLASLLIKYGERHPDVQRLKLIVEEEKQAQLKAEKEAATALALRAKETENEEQPAVAAAPKPLPGASKAMNSQMVSVEQEIKNSKREQDRLTKSIGVYQAKLEAGPVREQEITDLVRDYDISKNHYSQLLDKKLAAEMATQLEIKQKGEKFTILDPAQVAQRPSRPNRVMIVSGGALSGLALGLVAALGTELLGISVVLPAQATAAAGVPVLGEIPLIVIPNAKSRKKAWMKAGVGSGVAALLALGALLIHHFRAAGL